MLSRANEFLKANLKVKKLEVSRLKDKVLLCKVFCVLGILRVRCSFGINLRARCSVEDGYEKVKM